MLRKIWERWKIIAQKIGDFQARLILTLVYFIAVMPFGILVRLLSDPLAVKKKNRETMWFPKELDEPTLENARRQA